MLSDWFFPLNTIFHFLFHSLAPSTVTVSLPKRPVAFRLPVSSRTGHLPSLLIAYWIVYSWKANVIPKSWSIPSTVLHKHHFPFAISAQWNKHKPCFHTELTEWGVTLLVEEQGLAVGSWTLGPAARQAGTFSPGGSQGVTELSG